MKPSLNIIKSVFSVYNRDLIKNQPKTYLSASIASGVSSFTVDSITDLVVFGKDGDGTDAYLLIGNIGDLDAEIIQTHASTAPTGSTVTLAATTTTVKAHTESDPVICFNYNQIEYNRATTAGGTPSVLATIAINPCQEYSTYVDKTNTTGYATVRFKNVVYGNTYSEYSVEVPYTGYAQNTVGRAIIETYEELKLNPDFDYGIIEVNNCLEDIEMRKKSWTPKKKLGYKVGQTALWTQAITLPTDIKNAYDPLSIIEVRLGDEDVAMTYLDYQRFKEQMEDANNTTLSAEVAIGAITATLTSSYDFSEAGSLGIVGQTAEVTYTANAQSTGILTAPGKSAGLR